MELAIVALRYTNFAPVAIDFYLLVLIIKFF